MIKLFSLLATFIVISAAFSEKARYDNYQLFKITPRSTAEVELLAEVMKSETFSFWNEPRSAHSPVSLMVAPHQRAQFEEFIQDHKLQNELVIPNIQEIIDEQEMVLKNAPKVMEWNSYHTLKEIYEWLDELAKKHNVVKVVVGGRSYEGREIKGIEINFGNNLTNVFLEAGIHAREWISPAATTWMINEILNSPPDSVFRQFNYLYFPVFNPDGYVYTWERDRMWRKTRTPYKYGGRSCYGADPNRNWPCHWNEVGCSNNPCTEIYAGPKPLSEIECKTMAEYIQKRESTDRKSDIYISFHSFSQLLMYPWGYTKQPSQQNAVWHKIANAAITSLRGVHGTAYRAGQISTTIYPASGTTVDWYYDALKPFIAFVYELRDKGTYGFLLPPKQILPSGEETLASFKTILEEYKKHKRYYK